MYIYLLQCVYVYDYVYVYVCVHFIGSSEILGVIDQPANSTQITCKDPFFFSNGTCLPQCGKWKQYDDRTSVAVDTIVILSAVLGLGAGALVLIFSCIWRKKM